MNKGILIFAHNSFEIDYALMAMVSGKLAKKSLSVPVSLATDKSTISWMKMSEIYDQANTIFDKIIEIEEVKEENFRKLHDGDEGKKIPFKNANRLSAWDITPYDRTLLVDSDFLIFTDRLNSFWEVEEDVMISTKMNDICGPERIGYHDRYVSDTGVHLYWATTVMFTKNEKSKLFFDLVAHVKQNYDYYSILYGFDARQYRNDISFSVAKHILDGFQTKIENSLPPIYTTIDKDILISVNKDKLLFLVTQSLDSNYTALTVSDLDIHVMNKQSLIRNAKQLLEL